MSKKPSDTLLLSEQYPVYSSWELTLAPTGIVRGRVYTTDNASGCIVLLVDSQSTSHSSKQSQKKQASAPTIHIIQAKHVVQAKPQRASANVSDMPMQPPTKINRKVLEDKERKAIKLAEESMRQINDKATPAGQACFDRLLKACYKAHWVEGTTSIIVLDEIRVDPPYAAANCSIVSANSGQASASLERVQKIVSAVGASNLNQSASTK
ncbi:hypothetical protein MPSEU_000360000 [Mayamaea pseudoterrestris]|nr:hypothetical protein MPSEU_000360000 [Mayamaea pseudoterrestris]